MAIPEENYVIITPRSGLVSKHSIDVGAGFIDADYCCEVKVQKLNLYQKDFDVSS